MVAFAATFAYRPRACYAGIAEASVYVERAFRRHGAGRLALESLIAAAAAAGFWKLVSRIFVENTASRRLVASLGFREVGIYEKHGSLDGVWRDVVIVEKLLAQRLTPVGATHILKLTAGPCASISLALSTSRMTSASVVLSRMWATASRTRRITRRVPQVCSSLHSSQRL